MVLGTLFLQSYDFLLALCPLLIDFGLYKLHWQVTILTTKIYLKYEYFKVAQEFFSLS